MRKPAAGTPEEESRRRRRRLLGIVAVLVTAAVVVVAVLAYVLMQPGPPLDLRSVGFSPDPAVPDETVTVTAHVQGGTFLAPVAAQVSYDSFFGNGPSGSSSLFHVSGDAYTTTIGPFSNGSVVWLVVGASDGHRLEFASNLTLTVGTVSQGGATGLRIDSVVLTPPHPTSLDTPTLPVNATSSAPIESAELSAKYFGVSGYFPSSGGSTGDLQRVSEGNYTSFPGMFFGIMPYSYGTTVGTRWFYRVGVQDSAGAAVLSPVYTFTVALPPL